MSQKAQKQIHYELAKQQEMHRQKEVSSDGVREIEKHYRDGIITYSEGLYRYTLEISKLETEIGIEKKSIHKDEETLFSLERQIEYDENLLEQYNNRFSKKIGSIQELNREYREMMDTQTYLKTDKRKLYELQEILDEIEELEITLMQCELERINLLLKLQPKRREIAVLEREMKMLKLDKSYFESTGLQQIVPVANHKKAIVDAVDTEILES